MRILLVEGKQKELLKREKDKRNLGWIDFANYLGIKYPKLWSFVNENTLIDESTFNKLILKKEYEKFIVEKKLENWGRSKGGKISTGNTKNINIPKKRKDLAELWGILLGDGHVQKIKSYKVGVYRIDIAGHSINDRDYLMNYVKPLCEKLFKIKARFYFSKSSKAIHLILDSRKLVDFFEENGFKSGNKINNKLVIPDWIKKDLNFLAACLRGLYDTDGSFYRLAKQNSYQVQFTNLNHFLLVDVRESLLKLEINPSKIICNKSIVITKRSEIEKFYKTIGFSNPKHLNKIKALF